MGCGSCGSGGCSSAGCGRNGGCATGGCNKLNSYDWLGNMLPPDKAEVDNVYEVRFKNTRKGFYRNVHGLRLFTGDRIVVESDRGYDVGTISLGGVVAELQMKKKGYKKSLENTPRIFRLANENDLELLKKVRDREASTRARAREIIEELKLDMKLSDVEFQGDNSKAIFYYIADHRVDFRELIKLLAREFRIRVEMKQIGLRHEAGLVGGIGSCGRELCCSTWLTEFKTVSTSAARYQNLSLNPMKISGLCGRLKCCLNYELDTYLDALMDFPKVEKLQTDKGTLHLQKTDIFKGKMWFSYQGETNWYPLDLEEVKRILALNEKGQKPETVFKDIPTSSESKKDETFDFVDVVGQAKTLDAPSRKSRRSNRKKKSKRRGGGPSNRSGNNSNRSGNNNPPSRRGKGRGNRGRNNAQNSGNSDNQNAPASKGGEASNNDGKGQQHSKSKRNRGKSSGGKRRNSNRNRSNNYGRNTAGRNNSEKNSSGGSNSGGNKQKPGNQGNGGGSSQPPSPS